jgi:hypothetical protein
LLPALNFAAIVFISAASPLMSESHLVIFAESPSDGSTWASCFCAFSSAAPAFAKAAPLHAYPGSTNARAELPSCVTPLLSVRNWVGSPEGSPLANSFGMGADTVETIVGRVHGKMGEGNQVQFLNTAVSHVREERERIVMAQIRIGIRAHVAHRGQ